MTLTRRAFFGALVTVPVAVAAAVKARPMSSSLFNPAASLAEQYRRSTLQRSDRFLTLENQIHFDQFHINRWVSS